MLRGFINCKTTEERINYIVNSNAEDWTDAELDSIMEIIGVKGDYANAAISDKLSVIATTLSFAKKADDTRFDKIEDDGKAADDIAEMKNAFEYARLAGFYMKSTVMQ